MATTLKKQYDEKIAPALMKQFNYSSPMQIPKLVKIVLNEGLGDATQDKKIIERLFSFNDFFIFIVSLYC